MLRDFFHASVSPEMPNGVESTKSLSSVVKHEPNCGMTLQFETPYEASLLGAHNFLIYSYPECRVQYTKAC